mmetsp:Transcript_23675/g.43328  ORF Transcript_23675/g.43328 Transcript_23675/m.43328 type:complete len:124 (+) Transcript_23675:239-610(+)
MVLHYGIQVLYSRTNKLEPIIPNQLVGSQHAALVFLIRCIKVRACAKVAVANIALKWLLWMQVPRVHVRVRVVRIHTEQATGVNKLACKCDAEKNEKTGEIVVAVYDVARKEPIWRALHTTAG